MRRCIKKKKRREVAHNAALQTDTQLRHDGIVEVSLCLLQGKGSAVLETNAAGNNIYSRLHCGCTRMYKQGFNLNQTLTSLHPGLCHPSPTSILHSACHPIMSTTSCCQAVFKHKDRDSITAEWLSGVITELRDALTHLLMVVRFAGKGVKGPTNLRSTTISSFQQPVVNITRLEDM